MKCFDEILNGDKYIIGLRGYPALTDLSVPLSGLFINDIPGITLKVAAAVNNEEQQTGLELIKQILRTSTLLVVDDLRSKIMPQYNFNNILFADNIGRYTTGYHLSSADNKGMQISSYASDYARVFIQQIDIKLNTGGAFNVIIDDDGIINTYPVSIVAGVKYSLYPNYLCENKKVKIYLDTGGSVVEYAKGYLSKLDCDCDCDYDCCDSNRNVLLNIKGWNGTDEDGYFYGISPYLSLQCEEQLFICRMLNRMYFLFWYRAGVEFLNEVINSKRLNPMCLMAKEQATELRDYLRLEYDEKFETFIQSLKQFLDNNKDVCLNCYGNTYVQQTA